MYWLARIHDDQADHPPYALLAATWYLLAALKGHVLSQCNVGVSCMTGRGTERNPEHATFWYKLAADQGDGWACYLLGLSYRDGAGVRRNARWAKYWLARAAAKNVKEARRALEKFTTFGMRGATNDPGDGKR